MRYKAKILAATGDKAGCTKSPYVDAYTLSEWFVTLNYFKEKEAEYEKTLLIEGKGIPLFEMIIISWGGGPILAAHIMSHYDIARGDTISSIWKYFGYDPTEKYNPGKGKDLKSPLYASLSISLIRKNSPYRKDYDDMKAREISHGGAICRLIKLWLSHYWERARTLAGLPVTEPYAIKHMGHDGYKSAIDYGWPTNEQLDELNKLQKSA